jgi:exodeoxyribonuclease VII large subunit
MTTKSSNILTVSQLNRLAKQLLEDHFPAVQVQGEISNFSQPSSGHWYLTLKDAGAQVRCAMFRNRNMLVRCKPKDGMQVIVKARLSLYEGRGDYQLLLESMEDAGAGAMRQAFEQLYQKLQMEGLFAPERKKPLPSWPRHVAVITSSTGAAIRDIISVFKRRFPATLLTIVPVSVQGQQSAPELRAAVALVNRREGCLADVDTILLARGGGSLEDLWSFNDEGLARAIATSTLPVVSAVGHEVDFTIADFVADVRAATPSAAAELLSPHRQQLLLRVADLHLRQRSFINEVLANAQRQLSTFSKRLRHPGRRLQEQAQHLDHLELRLTRAIGRQQLLAHTRLTSVLKRLHLQSPDKRLQQDRQQLLSYLPRLTRAVKATLQRKTALLAAQSQALNAISPLATLSRGYSLTTTAEHKVVTRFDEVQVGATIHTRLAEGSIESTVIAITAPAAPNTHSQQ